MSGRVGIVYVHHACACSCVLMAWVHGCEQMMVHVQRDAVSINSNYLPSAAVSHRKRLVRSSAKVFPPKQTFVEAVRRRSWTHCLVCSPARTFAHPYTYPFGQLTCLPPPQMSTCSPARSPACLPTRLPTQWPTHCWFACPHAHPPTG